MKYNPNIINMLPINIKNILKKSSLYIRERQKLKAMHKVPKIIENTLIGGIENLFLYFPSKYILLDLSIISKYSSIFSLQLELLQHKHSSIKLMQLSHNALLQCLQMPTATIPLCSKQFIQNPPINLEI
jgi:hypothetical protein